MAVIDADDPSGPRVLWSNTFIVNANGPTTLTFTLDAGDLGGHFRQWTRSLCHHPLGASNKCAGALVVKSISDTFQETQDVVDGVVTADWDVYDDRVFPAFNHARYYWSPNAFLRPELEYTTEQLPLVPGYPTQSGDFVTATSRFVWWDKPPGSQGDPAAGTLRVTNLKETLADLDGEGGYFKVEIDRMDGSGARSDRWDAFYEDNAGNRLFYGVETNLPPNDLDFRGDSEEWRIHYPVFKEFGDCLAGPGSIPCQEELQVRLGRSSVEVLTSVFVSDESSVISPDGGYFVRAKFYRALQMPNMLLDMQFELEEPRLFGARDLQFDTVDFYQVPLTDP